MEEVVAPVLHNSDPLKPVAVRVEVLLQLSTTLTTVAAGEDPGAATPLALALVHPLSVCVTV